MLRIEKVIGRLPDVLFASTLYFVRVGLGLDIYVTDFEGQAAHKVNTDHDQVLLTKLHQVYTDNSEITEDDTILSALLKLNTRVGQLSSALSGKLDIGAEAVTSKQWTIAINLSLVGGVKGSVQVDGSKDVAIDVTLSDIDMGNL